jgi:hypothetical protein
VKASPSTDVRTQAQGFYVADVTNCSLEQAEDFALSTNAVERKPDTYLSYSKVFTGDPDEFDDDLVSAMSWSTVYKIKPLAAAITAEVHNEIRRIAASDSDDGIILTQDVLTSPGAFEPADGGKFELDYQMEIFQDQGGKVSHFLAMWRNMWLGSFSAESDLFVSIQTDGMIDWVEDNDATCRGEGVQPIR